MAAGWSAAWATKEPSTDSGADTACEPQTEVCDDTTEYDAEGDGHDAEAWGEDCDDTDARVHPDAAERCGNDIDDDCDGEVVEESCVVYVEEAMAILEGDESGQYVGYLLSNANDLDGDGYDELMLSGDHPSVVYGPITGTGDWADEWTTLFDDGSMRTARAAADIDADGELDLLLVASAGDTSAVYIVDGSTTGEASPGDVGFTLQDSPSRDGFGTH